MTGVTGYTSCVGMGVVASSERPAYVMAACTGRLRVVMAIHAVWYLAYVGIMDKSTVGGYVALVALIVWFDNGAGARYAGGVAACTVNIVGRSMVVMGEGGGPSNVMTACTGRCRTMTCVTVSGSGGDMSCMGGLVILGGMAGVT